MTYQIVEPSIEAWDAFVGAHPRAHLLQLSAWGDLKAGFGWRPVRVALAGADGRLVAGVQPYGPLVDWSDAGQVRDLLAGVDRVARQQRAVFLKIEPGFGLDGVDFTAYGFRRSAQTIQPPRTIVLDIRDEDETILARMNQGTRRNIRKSIKNNIETREGTRDDVQHFNALLAETGERDDFGVHTPGYYERAYDLFVPSGRAALILGRYRDQDLAGVMVFALGDSSWYLYGASSGRERQRMASYGVQWAGIQWAKAKGATDYDMYGVPDEDPASLEAQFETRSDGLWGVYRFKRGWGGTVRRSVGAWDRVYHSAFYAIYLIGNRLIR
jgi:peptidoglycan pentaglycine glycine transferase (the first glycine)